MRFSIFNLEVDKALTGFATSPESDDCSTAEELWRVIMPLVLKSQVIYDPAYMNEEFNNIWRKHGYTTINEYKNFFDDENLPEKEVFDVIVSK